MFIPLVIFVVFASPSNASDSKPNVVFLAVDDMNDWIGCLGTEPRAITPNFDRLASRGVCFSNAHTGACYNSYLIFHPLAFGVSFLPFVTIRTTLIKRPPAGTLCDTERAVRTRPLCTLGRPARSRGRRITTNSETTGGNISGEFMVDDDGISAAVCGPGWPRPGIQALSWRAEPPLKAPRHDAPG